MSIDATAAWTDDRDERRDVWGLYGRGSPRGVGYPPGRFWPDGPDGPTFRVLRLRPYRIQVLRGREPAAGVPPRIWRRPP